MALLKIWSSSGAGLRCVPGSFTFEGVNVFLGNRLCFDSVQLVRLPMPNRPNQHNHGAWQLHPIKILQRDPI